MGVKCSKCGMESDRDDICTWCNADLKPKRAASEEKGPPASAPAEPAAPAPARRERPSATEIAQAGRPPWLIPAVVGGGAIVLLIVALVIVGVMASGPPPAEGNWEAFVSKDKSFAAWYPDGWGEPSNSGAAGSYVNVVWKATKLCRVGVKGTQTAGSVGDTTAAKERMAGGNLPIEQGPDGAMLGFFDIDGFAGRRPDLEQTAMQAVYNFASVKAAYTEYTYTRRVGLVPIKMKGMRWGSFQGDYGYHAYAEAPEKHWAAFKPIAEKIVGGVQFGAGG